MRTTEILATIAVTGAVATFALLNVGTVNTGSAFLSTPMTDAERQFINFVSENHRSYGTKEEYEYRLSLFSKAIETVKEHNAKGATWTMAINKFADMSDYEYKQMLGYKPLSKKNITAPTTVEEVLGAAPEVDWVAQGSVNAIQNQGSCGSCWAFSAVGTIEGAHWRKTGTLEKFSEQQLVDCAFLGGYGNLGCSGGLMDSAFQYAIDVGLETEANYPYTAVRGACTYSAAKKAVQLTKFTDVTPDSIKDLQAAVQHGPVSVAIEADQLGFQLYSSGVMTTASSKCGTTLDHGVVVVGSGVDAVTGQDYWKVRNSWGVTWGEKGYFRLAQEAGHGVCGVQMQPSYADI
jgi:C1A family cysteine protease